MKYDHQSIIEYFKQNQDADFVAFMRTAWHSYGVAASLLKLSENEKLKGLVLLSIEDFENEKPLVNTDVFSVLKNVDCEIGYKLPIDFPKSKAKLIKFKLAPAKYYLNHSKGTRKIYVINPMNTAKLFISKLKKAMPEAQIISVVVDEGLGNYFRSTYNWAVEMYQSSKSKKAFIGSLISNKANKAYVKSAEKRGELIDFNLLQSKSKGFAPNGDVPKYYCRVIENESIDSSCYSEYENAVIISAQLYYETNQIKNDYDLQLYNQIINILGEKGIPTVFKPHPRDTHLERYNCLNCFVDTRNTVPQENIICSLKSKPKAVLSFTSTGLVSAKLFFDVKTVSLNKCVPKDKLQSSLLDEFNGFNTKFGDIVDIPQGIDELITLLIGE